MSGSLQPIKGRIAEAGDTDKVCILAAATMKNGKAWPFWTKVNSEWNHNHGDGNRTQISGDSG